MQPARIGRYTVVGQLGHGAMGVVYSARDEQMGRDVAVKVMTNQLESDPEARARFFREAQLTSKLLHRNVVTVLDLGEENGHPFLVMELLKGSTLNRALREPRLAGLEPKLDLMIQACDGLARAHAAGVVHRDIKPGNLFVQADGSLKILDFGVARLADSQMTQSGLVIGTPDYMSPEQARGDEVDARSDIFSVAAVCYFMITGRRPFDANDVPSVLRKVINEDPAPVPPHQAPVALTRIVMRALRKNPDNRYQTCAELAADLGRVRRFIDNEARQLAAAIIIDFDSAVRLSEGLVALRSRLDHPGEGVDHAGLLRARFPFLVTRGTDSGALPAAFRRDRLLSLQEELRTMRQAIVTDLEAIAIGAVPKHAAPPSVEVATQVPSPRGRTPRSEQSALDPVIVRTPAREIAAQTGPDSAAGGSRSGLVRWTAGKFGRWFTGRPRG